MPSLRNVVEPLGLEQLQLASYASEWSIAQVLSHLGPQSEIFGLFLDAGLSGKEPPGREVFGPIWDTWNARSPQAQAADALKADEATLKRFESLDSEQREGLRFEMFGMRLDTAGVARLRLAEHAVHTWDVAVTLDPAATVSSDAVGLLVDTLGQLVARAGKPDGTSRQVHVVTSDPERQFTLEIGEAAVALADFGAGEDRPELRLPAEGFVRLVYGRLDPDHTPPLETDGVALDELRRIFPGV